MSPPIVFPKTTEHIHRVYDQLLAKLRKLPNVKWRPELYQRESDVDFAVTGLSLVFFTANLRRIITKEQLIRFLRHHGCCEVAAPNPRHFGMQNGLFFLIKDSYHALAKRTLRPGEYCLYSLDKPHPSRPIAHRSVDLSGSSFAALKAEFDCRCATCGSRESEPNFKNSTVRTRLEKGHMDPLLPLSMDNCIPMCTVCNQVYKNRFAFNRRGFVVRVLDGGVQKRATSGKMRPAQSRARRPHNIATSLRRSARLRQRK